MTKLRSSVRTIMPSHFGQSLNTEFIPTFVGSLETEVNVRVACFRRLGSTL